MANGNDNIRFGGGMFGAGILPGVNQSDYEQRLRRLQQMQAEHQGSQRVGAGPGSGLLRRAGAGLGQALQQRYRPDEVLSQEEQGLFAVQEKGNQRFAARLAGMSEEERAGLSPMAKGQMQLFDMAQAAADTGNMEVYAKLLQEMQRRRQEDNLVRAKLAAAEGTPPDPEDVPGNSAYDRRVMNELWNATSKQRMTDSFRATQTQLDSVNGVIDLIDEMTERGQNPTALTSPTGKVVTVLNTVKQALGAVGDEGVGWFSNFFRGKDDDFRTENTPDGSPDATTGEVSEAFNRNFGQALETIPGAAERARYKALMIQMAYAAWRSMEGSGSRQASNQDIIMALDSIGANGGDINAVLQTILQNTEQSIGRERAKTEDVITAAIRNGVRPEYINDTLYGGRIGELTTGMQALIDRAAPYLAEDRAGLEASETGITYTDEEKERLRSAGIVFE